MEQLKELERAQCIMSMMQSVAAIDPSDNSNADSNRFLANFILFMMQPCGELVINQKCKLISEYFPKISSAFFNEALHLLCDQGNAQIEDSMSHHCDDDSRLLQTDCEDVAMVSLDSMQRANSTLQDFCRSYFMFHEMDANNPESIFKYLPLLSFTESYIYQVRRSLGSSARADGDVYTHHVVAKQVVLISKTNAHSLRYFNLEKGIFELITQRGRNMDQKTCTCGKWELDTINEKLLQLPYCGIPDFDRRQNWIPFLPKTSFRTDTFRPLAVLLESYGMFTERIRYELKCGEEYWALERKLCSALISKQEIKVEDVMRAIHLKSFDYRVLNLLLYRLNGKEINETHMEFLSVSEFLVEVSDDLFDYEDDVLENNFNILRMFVGIHGASAAPALLAKSITEAEEKYNCLLNTLDPQLSFKYRKRCEEATKEGGKVFGPPLGTWSIPPIIEDEDLYRNDASKNMPPGMST